jgi:predicted DNA-binding transcriptional regulator AlpA
MSTTFDLSSDLDALLREDCAAEFLGFTRRALQRWRVAGGGPQFVKISSRAIRYRKRDLIRWAEARLRASTSDPGASASAPTP